MFFSLLYQRKSVFDGGGGRTELVGGKIVA